MDSEDDFEIEPLPSSPIVQPKLKRLKKASRVSQNPLPSEFDNNFRVSENPLPSSPPIVLSELGNNSGLDDLSGESVPEIESLGDENVADSAVDVDLGAKRVLEFDSVDDELDGNVTEKMTEEEKRVLEFDSVGDELDGNVTEKKTEEFGSMNNDEIEKKQQSVDESNEDSEKKENKKNKKKKKRIDDGDGSEKKLKESISNKRKAEKERQENLKKLRAESQRLLRETRDAAFKPVPLVQKPISSILDKIRKRKLEFLKKSNVAFDDNDDFAVDIDPNPCRPSEEMNTTIEKPELEETLAAVPAVTENNNTIEKTELEETPAVVPVVNENNLSTPHMDGSNNAIDHSSHESISSPTVMASEPVHAFRAPVDDTQDLFSDSEINEIKEEALNEKLNNPSKEVFTPSMLAMNLKLDSAPIDDDISSDDEDSDKENTLRHLHRSADMSLPPSGDPVKAFVDEEAEEEDDSDNDLHRFKDNEEGEDDDDIEELNDMIATGYEEKPIDREKRDQLHQQWLEQQDTTGMDNLLQKLNCGTRLKESDDEDDEEDDKSKETENESDNDVEDLNAPSDAGKINLKKLKQMIPQMFMDKDDPYVSSDEETEEKLVKQSFSYRVEKKAQFFSPAEDESSRGVFNLIKKLNVVPDTKKKGRTPSIFDMPHIGQTTSISSKSSFVGRASNQFMPPQKRGSSKVRTSFIFERDDSNSRPSVPMSEDSSDTILRESQAPKAVSAKFQRNSQNKYATSNSESQVSNVSLLEVLRRSSLHTERGVQNAGVQLNESVFEVFKLPKKSMKTGERV